MPIELARAATDISYGIPASAGEYLLRREMAKAPPPKTLGYEIGFAAGLDVLLLRAAMADALLSDRDVDDLRMGNTAEFPVAAEDLMPDYTGAALGQKLRDLEQRWVASEFRLTKSELLS